MITADDVQRAIEAQAIRGCGIDDDTTAKYLDYDEDGVAEFAATEGIPHGWMFAGAVSLGIEIERDRNECN